MKKSLFFYIFTIFFLIICLLFSAFSNLLKTLSATTEVFATQEKPIIIIDAGHGGIDGGTSGKNGVLEKDINLAISKTLAALFKAGGYNVLETRTEDILLSGNAQTHKKQAVNSGWSKVGMWKPVKQRTAKWFVRSHSSVSSFIFVLTFF